MLTWWMTSLNMRKSILHNAALVDESLNMRKSILHNADLVDDFTKHAKEYSP